MPHPDLLKAGAAAKLLKVNPKTIDRWGKPGGPLANALVGVGKQSRYQLEAVLRLRDERAAELRDQAQALAEPAEAAAS